MSQRPPSTLHDLCELYGGRHMLLICSNPDCRRRRIFRVHEIRDHCKRKGWSDRWRDLPQHFRCAICRSRPGLPQWIEKLDEPDAPRAPKACLAPFGIDPWAWALASPADRDRLVAARR